MTRQQQRRAVTGEERRRDPERTRQKILRAALSEFAAHGYAATRTSDIAGRAGVNTQLISYYFGGKEGLYRELIRRWHERDNSPPDPGRPLSEVVTGYFKVNVDEPERGRLLIWAGLTDASDDPHLQPRLQQHVEDLRRRQAAGEIAPDIAPAYLLLTLFAATAAGSALPNVVRAVTGLDPTSKEFAERYSAELTRIVGHLAPAPVPAPAPAHQGDDRPSQ
ncbi:TetR family transcriptional regulator [Streptomyces sp. NPDC004647]|uniref:TetR/AcrR family transcriptional regulator n=1 Tax=Streptomyces sp. NPDC004647 TaxID=3154671 RepID=UPI0033BA94C1